MKKPTKSIITSSLLAVAFGALSVGSTFALFTSQSKTEISVESGIVNVESKATLVNYSSSVDGTNHDFEGTETSYSNDKVGNLFKINGDNSIVTIDKMVPGDSLKINLSALNKSNVRTKTRLTVEHSKVGTQKDLFPALEFSFKAGSLNATDLFRWQENDAVADITNGVALYGNSGIEVTIKLPDGDNGQILFGSENHDNQYQDAACSIAFSLQAVQGNAATSPIDEINAYLAAELMFEGHNNTMHDAVLDMKEIQYGLTNLDVLDGYVYDLANDRFVKESSVTANKLDYFKVCSSMPTTQDFSIYAVGDGWTTVEGLTVGFDAGDTSGITSIVYNRHDATVGQEVTIRTNGGTLTVDAPLDTIHHYGDAQMVTLTAVGNSSYYENGSVSLVDVKKGRLVITNEKEASVGTIYLSATNDAYDGIILATQSNAELPDVVARESVTRPESGEKLVVTIQQVDSNGTADPAQTEKIYLYPEKDVKEKEKGYDVSDLGLLVVEALSAEGQAQAEEQLADKDPEVINSVKETNVEDKEEVVKAATMFAGGKGTEEDPYLIDNVLGLNNIDKKCNSESSDLTYFKLISDIIASDEDLISYTDYWNNPRSALFGKISNAVIDGNNHKITANISGATIFGDVRESKLSSLNVTINGTGASLIFYSENIDLSDITIDGQIYWNTGNCGAFVIYARYNVTMVNCVNKAELSTTTGDTTMYCAVFFGYGFPNDSRITMTNCSNKGSLTAGRASLLMANCSYGYDSPTRYIDFYLNYCSNDGQIISTSVNDDNNLLVSIISDKAYAYHFTIDGTTYTTSTTTKWTDALPSSLLIGKGTFVKGSDDTLGIAENADGTFTIIASNKSVAKYIVSVGVYTATEIGSSRSYVTEEISANGDQLVSTLKNLKFIDNAWIEANPTAQIGTLAGNTIYTIGDESFYLVNEPDRCNVGGTPKIAEMISVTAVDSQGKILSSASL